MSATKPAELTLALQNATEGSTAIIDWPTDTNIIDICQLLFPILMQTNYDKITITHNLSGVILPTDRYGHIYGKGPYGIPPVFELYNHSIKKDVTRTEIHPAEGKHENKRKNCALYDTANRVCKNFIMEVVDETWYKDIEDPNKFYTYVTTLKLINHLTEFCSGIHVVNTFNILQLMKTLYVDAKIVLQFIN